MDRRCPQVWLVKIKRPGGAHCYFLRRWSDDECGTWLFGPAGSGWSAPHDDGVIPVDVLVLLAPGRPFVAWWVADPDDMRIELDVCLPPTSTQVGWRFVDLELDPVRHESGSRVEIEDWDEYHAAIDSGHMSMAEAELAARTATDLAEELAHRNSVWIESGWRRLHEAAAALK